MPEFLHEEPVYESALVNVADICCRPHDADRGGEETTAQPSIAFVRGGVFCKHIGGEDVLADANHLVFFNGGEPYRVSHPVAGGDDCTSIRFAPEVFAEAAAAFDPRAVERPGQPFAVHCAVSSPQSAVLLHRIRAAAQTSAADSLRIDELCFELLGELTGSAFHGLGCRANPARAKTRRAHRRLADQTRLMLAARFTERLPLADLAEAVGTSPYHLVRVFRGEVGTPVHRYLSRLRLRSAVERLSDGEGNLTSLALDLGFAGHSHFTDSFRREFGISPSQFRQLIAERG